MKISVLSDLHIHNYKRFDINGSRLENTLKVLDDIFLYNEKNKIETILFCGDLYDNQKMIPTIVINKVIERLYTLFEKYQNQNIIAISGNHDHAGKNLSTAPCITALKHLSIVFAGRFVLIDNEVIKIGEGINIFGIPYYEYKEDFFVKLEEADKKLQDGEKNILMIHQTPRNEINPNIPFHFDTSTSLFDRWDFVLCGHIHMQSQLEENFLLVGSPLHRDLADEGEEKGFLVFDSNNLKEYKFLPLNYPKFKRGISDKEEDNTNYIIPLIKEEEGTNENDDFPIDEENEELVKAYFGKTGKKDDKLLETGLNLLRI